MKLQSVLEKRISTAGYSNEKITEEELGVVDAKKKNLTKWMLK